MCFEKEFPKENLQNKLYEIHDILFKTVFLNK